MKKLEKKINLKKRNKRSGLACKPYYHEQNINGIAPREGKWKKKARRSIIYKKLMLKEEIKKN
jgi:hypothetical protein